MDYRIFNLTKNTICLALCLNSIQTNSIKLPDGLILLDTENLKNSHDFDDNEIKNMGLKYLIDVGTNDLSHSMK